MKDTSTPAVGPQPPENVSASSPLSNASTPAASAARSRGSNSADPTVTGTSRSLAYSRTQRETNMEGEDYIAALEVPLVVQVRGVGDDPPAALRAMHVPDVVTNWSDELRGRFLHVHDLFVGLTFHVGPDLVLLMLRSTHLTSVHRPGPDGNPAFLGPRVTAPPGRLQAV